MGGGNVDYSARTNPVTVTADGVADDGEAGENNNVLEGATLIGGSAPTTSPSFRPAACAAARKRCPPRR